MPSPPSLSHSVSDPNLSSPRLFPPQPSSNNNNNNKINMIAKLKVSRRSSASDFRTLDQNKNNNNDGYACYSPYYRGLTDQSLAINNELHAPQNLQSNSNKSNNLLTNTNNLLTKYSPYYKGLTDFSLVLHGRPQQLTTSSNDECGWRLHELEGPYYTGLIDYSLAIRGFEIGGGYGPVGGPSNIGLKAHHNISASSSYTSAFAMNLGLCLGYKEDIMHKATEEAIGLDHAEGGEHCILPPRPPKVKSDMHVEVEAEKKPLGERASEEMIAEPKAMDTENKDLGSEKEKKNRTVGISEQRVFGISESESPCKDGGGVVGEEMKDVAREGRLKEFLWANKYQPKALEDFICHRDIATQLQHMVKEGCACNHFIFEGPSGVGKRCMIRAMLREVFGKESIKVIEEQRTFNLMGEMVGSIHVGIKKSAHHVEVNLSETKGYEKNVVEDLFRQTYDIVNNLLPCSPYNCQAIIIYEAEKLSTEALLYTKWMLERYKGCSKVFFCCSDEAKLQIIKPLCTTVRLSLPSTQEIVAVLEYIAKKEGKQISPEFLRKIVEKSKNNLRQAIRSLEATSQHKDSIKEDELILTGWEDDISNIAKNIIQEQSPKQLYIIHVKLQNLMIHNVSPDFVYKYLVSELKSLVDESLTPAFAKLEKEYNVNNVKLKGAKQSGHAQSYLKVEEFIAKFMSWYKNSTEICSKQVQVDVGT